MDLTRVAEYRAEAAKLTGEESIAAAMGRGLQMRDAQLMLSRALGE